MLQSPREVRIAGVEGGRQVCCLAGSGEVPPREQDLREGIQVVTPSRFFLEGPCDLTFCTRETLS